MSLFSKEPIYVDFKRSGPKLGVQISFGYGIDGFEDLLNVIKGCGGSWDKSSSRWIVKGTFAFYCVDILRGMKEFEVICSEYFLYYLNKEMKKLERNIIASKAVKPKKPIDIPVPDGKSYFEFQKAAVEFFNERGQSILLADDMGAGKTITSIAIANFNRYKKVLIVCPDSAKDKVWAEAVDAWWVGNPTVRVASATRKWKDADVIIINYEIVKKFEKQLIDTKFDFLIVDEAHNLKGVSTQRTKALKSVAKSVKAKAFLTGTPIMNRPAELYSLLQILTGSAFGDQFSFSYRYCAGKLIELEPADPANNKKAKMYLDDKGSSNLAELNFKLRSTIMIRREKADIINEFPNVTRRIFQLDADYGKKSSQEYRQEVDRYATALAELKQKRRSFFDYRSYSKEVSNVKRYHFDQIAKIRHDLGVSKINDIANFVGAMIANGSKKIVLFIHHREVAEEINRRFKSNSIILYGGLSSKEKARLVTQFEEDPNINIFIGSIKASGVAYTLTVSHNVVFGELDWTPSMIDQCECRCIRLGQKNDVFVYYLVATNSLDQNMLRKINKKGKMIKTVMV